MDLTGGIQRYYWILAFARMTLIELFICRVNKYFSILFPHCCQVFQIVNCISLFQGITGIDHCFGHTQQQAALEFFDQWTARIIFSATAVSFGREE